MSLAADRPEFAPPPPEGTPRAVAFALVAHAVLIAALTWGVHWKRDAENDAVEAELWSTTVQQAAPRLSQPPTPSPAPVPPPPAPAPPPPPPPPPPAPRVQAPEPAPAPRPPDIALEREKKLKEQKEREREIEQAKQEKKMEAAKKAAQEKKALEVKRQAEEAAEEKREAQEQAREKAQADARKKKEAEAKQQQADAAKQQAEAAKKKEADAKAAAADRAATLKRMQGLAGASGDDNATGNALKSSGPSGSYGGRVAAAVRPNVVFPDADMVSGNPGAEFEVKLAPDGTIVGTPRMVKSSGLPAWDQAALRALQKTEKLPRDVDGRVPSALIVELKPKR